MLEGSTENIGHTHGDFVKALCLSVCTTKTTDPLSLCTGNSRLKRAGSHLELFLPILLKWRNNLYTWEQWPSGWKLDGGASYALIRWVQRGHFNLDHVVIHST
jgi:hypothetical protein